MLQVNNVLNRCVEATVCLTRHVRVKINMRTLLPSGLVLYASRPALFLITVKQLVCDGQASHLTQITLCNVKGRFFWTAL